MARNESVCSVAILQERSTLHTNLVAEPCLLTGPGVVEALNRQVYEWTVYAGHPLRDAAGHTLSALGRARRAVEASAQQGRALVESAPFLIGVYVGPELRIELANDAILTGWGKGPHVIGRRFADVLPELATQAVFERLHHVRTTGEPLSLRSQRLEIVIDDTPQRCGQLGRFRGRCIGDTLVCGPHPRPLPKREGSLSSVDVRVRLAPLPFGEGPGVGSDGSEAYPDPKTAVVRS